MTDERVTVTDAMVEAFDEAEIEYDVSFGVDHGWSSRERRRHAIEAALAAAPREDGAAAIERTWRETITNEMVSRADTFFEGECDGRSFDPAFLRRMLEYAMTGVLVPPAVERTRDDGWQDISTAPGDGREVLACFRGQFQWVTFIARSYAPDSGGTFAPYHASPTHWRPLPAPPTVEQGRTEAS